MGKKKKVTTKDIAEYANVSQSAVSMILNQKPNVSFSEETRQRVFMAAEELGYHKKKDSLHTRAFFIRSYCHYVSVPFQSLLHNPDPFDHRTCPRLWLSDICCPNAAQSQH